MIFYRSGYNYIGRETRGSRSRDRLITLLPSLWLKAINRLKSSIYEN